MNQSTCVVCSQNCPTKDSITIANFIVFLQQKQNKPEEVVKAHIVRLFPSLKEPLETNKMTLCICVSCIASKNNKNAV